MDNIKAFQTSGPITDFDKIVYIERNEDKKVLDYIRYNRHVTILGARQTGKTSLLYKLKKQLGEGFILIYIDLSAGDAIKDETGWYRFICERILRQVSDKFISNVEEAKLEPATNKIEFLDFLNNVALKVKPTDRIIMMLDEFGTVPELLHDNFFGSICVVARERTDDRKDFEKWIFVLAGATDPRELISLENKNSPFNVTERIYMSDFDKEGTRQVVVNLKAHGIQLVKEEEIINRIHEQTGGHPNLVQKICVNLMELGEKTVSPALVEKAVEKLITEGDENTQRIYKELDQDKSAKGLAIQILKGDKRKFDRDIKEWAKLELLGVIKRGNDGNCVIRSPICEKKLKNYLQENLREENRTKVLEKPHDKRDGTSPSLLRFSIFIAICLIAFFIITCVGHFFKLRGVLVAIPILIIMLVCAFIYFNYIPKKHIPDIVLKLLGIVNKSLNQRDKSEEGDNKDK